MTSNVFTCKNITFYDKGDFVSFQSMKPREYFWKNFLYKDCQTSLFERFFLFAQISIIYSDFLHRQPIRDHEIAHTKYKIIQKSIIYTAETEN